MKTNKYKRLIVSVISIVMIFSTMTSCGQDVNNDNSSIAASVAENGSSEKEDLNIDINVSRENGESISEVDSSEDDSMATSTTKTSDSSEVDDSSKTESSTKKTDDSSSGGDTTSSNATANTTKITSSATSKVTPQSTTKSTTKSTTTTTKTTTKQTTKATSSTSSPTAKPTGLTKLESAVWDISLDYSITYNNYRSNKNLAIIREELIKYGQEFCKQRNAPKYQVNSKMYPYYDKNGNPLYAPCDMKGNNIAVGSKVEFPYDEHEIPSSYSTAQERLSGVRAFIKAMQLYIERVICNSFRHGLENMQWNITYGYEYCGICWTVMTGFPDDWK